jgi:transcriptional regulator with XRE-family HTH domain
MSGKIQGDMLRAARELLGWSQETLATKAGCSLSTVRRLERDETGFHEDSREKLLSAFEAEGLAFIHETATEGAGLRWAAPRSAERPPAENLKARRKPVARQKDAAAEEN